VYGCHEHAVSFTAVHTRTRIVDEGLLVTTVQKLSLAKRISSNIQQYTEVDYTLKKDKKRTEKL